MAHGMQWQVKWRALTTNFFVLRKNCQQHSWKRKVRLISIAVRQICVGVKFLKTGCRQALNYSSPIANVPLEIRWTVALCNNRLPATSLPHPRYFWAIPRTILEMQSKTAVTLPKASGTKVVTFITRRVAASISFLLVGLIPWSRFFDFCQLGRRLILVIWVHFKGVQLAN